jgi:hypothetical protein
MQKPTFQNGNAPIFLADLQKSEFECFGATGLQLKRRFYCWRWRWQMLQILDSLS